MTGPPPLLCFHCRRPATKTFSAQGGNPIVARAESSCADHHDKSRAWCARAGPVDEEDIPVDPDAPDPGPSPELTLF